MNEEYHRRMALVRETQAKIKEQMNSVLRLEHSIVKEMQNMVDNGYTQLHFNQAMTARLCKAIQRARKDDAETFEFDGIRFFTDYANYLLQFLCGQFNLSMRESKDGTIILYDFNGRIVMPDTPREVNGDEAVTPATEQ